MRVNKLYRFICPIITILLLTGCLSKPQTKLSFAIKYQGKIQSCQQLNPNLMFYLSNFRQAKPLTIDSQKYSNSSVALIGANCNAESWQLTLLEEVTAGDALSFDIGVPFELNHANPLTAPAPLNISEMFWSWQLGHKFLRLDAKDYSFHLGSTGCQSPSRMRPANSPCQHPNRFTFTINKYQANKPIIFDLDALVNNIDTSTSCMSDQQNDNCQILFTQLRTPLFYQE